MRGEVGSANGSTAEVAATVAAVLRAAGLEVALRPVSALGAPDAAADALVAETGAAHWPAERLGGTVDTEPLRWRLGDEAFASAWATGCSLSRDRAVQAGLRSTVDPGRVQVIPRHSTFSGPHDFPERSVAPSSTG